MLHRKLESPPPRITKYHLSKVEAEEGNEGIYPGSDRFIALAKENPKLLGEILQKQISTYMKKLYKEKKAAGLSVHYSDPEYPGCWIREDADDRRFIVELDLKNGYKENVVREIPPRRKMA